MSKDSENFDQLVKLLALKKYEQPPPGYFDTLAGEITARILASESDPRISTYDPAAELGWAGRLWALLEAKPILAGAFGVAVCGLMITGILYSQRLPSTTETPETASALPPTAAVPALELTSANTPTNGLQPIGPQLPKGLFDGLYLRANNLGPQPANYTPAGN